MANVLNIFSILILNLKGHKSVERDLEFVIQCFNTFVE